jgi:NAD(P)-dependent dehydrogenase (short-subunit alcohol dehydrogenase family)
MSMSRPSGLAGKRALVTGAGSGIGRAIAVALAVEGAKVGCVDVFAETADETARSITDSGGTAWGLQCDVSKRAEVDRVVEALVAQGGGVEIAVNCAGVSSRQPFLEVSEEDWDRVIGVNLTGPFHVMQAAGKVMAANGGGCMVNVTSLHAEVANDMAPYVASKGGLRQLTKAGAVGLAPYNIRVNSVGPGPIETGMARPTDAPRTPQELRVLRGRIGMPEDVAGAVVFLCSDGADFITGVALYVDGGVLAAR